MISDKHPTGRNLLVLEVGYPNLKLKPQALMSSKLYYNFNLLISKLTQEMVFLKSFEIT